MIKSIQMKNCATYGTDVVPLSDMKKVNFIYGANGSGKSTISNFLKSPQDPLYHDCFIEWDSQVPVEIVVYNRQFREEHFKDDIDGIFTLGKATKDQIEEVEKLKLKRKQIEENISSLIKSYTSKKAEFVNAESLFKDSLWTAVLKKHEDNLAEAFYGLRNNKNKFFDEFIRRYNAKKNYTGSLDEILNRASTLYSKKPEKYDLISIDIQDEQRQIKTIIDDKVWNTAIIGNKDVPIAALINELHNIDWVRDGRAYVSNGSEKCPFCQRETIDVEFRNQLEQFFDATYESNINHIDALAKQYATNIESIIQKFSSVLYDSTKKQIAQISDEVYNNLIKSLIDVADKVEKMMLDKQHETSRKVTILSLNAEIEILQKYIKEANSNIVAHNDMVTNFNKERDKLTDDIWNYCLAEQQELIVSYNKEQGNREKALKHISEAQENFSKELEILGNEIEEKQKNITSVQPTVDEINRSLKAYGFDSFKIVPSPDKENSYQLQRLDGKLATHTLSEGEETFITFLYFMQFAKGSSDVSKISTNKIIVLDDPISSLDSTILYVVSAMVKQLIQDVKSDKGDVEQLIILTHNVFFHKEASFVDGRTKKDKMVNYWIISKNNNNSTIRPYKMDNPISTSYELLWREVRDNTESSIITIQNVMRRIIENYFGMLGKNKDDTLINSFESAEDKMICRSLLYWINDGSHSITDDLFIDSYSDSIDKYKNIFKQIFVNTGNQAHYNMMMGIKDDPDIVI